jgi:hypothetical protein
MRLSKRKPLRHWGLDRKELGVVHEKDVDGRCVVEQQFSP